MVTLGNAFCGFASITYVMRAQAAAYPEGYGRNLVMAGWLILLAMVFDALDGKVARLANQTSEFGIQLDSLSDAISFGVAPALIVKTIAKQQQFLERVGWVTGAMFMFCAILRLARFNVETSQDEESHQHFQGLPSPAAGGFIASLAVLTYSLRTEAEYRGLASVLEPTMDGLLFSVPVLAAALALLMISNVRYPHPVSRMLRGQEPFDYLVTVILFALFAVLTRPFSLPILFGGYVLAGVVIALKGMVMSRVEDVSRRHRKEEDAPHTPGPDGGARR